MMAQPSAQVAGPLPLGGSGGGGGVSTAGFAELLREQRAGDLRLRAGLEENFKIIALEAELAAPVVAQSALVALVGRLEAVRHRPRYGAGAVLPAAADTDADVVAEFEDYTNTGMRFLLHLLHL